MLTNVGYFDMECPTIPQWLLVTNRFILLDGKTQNYGPLTDRSDGRSACIRVPLPRRGINLRCRPTCEKVLFANKQISHPVQTSPKSRLKLGSKNSSWPMKVNTVTQIFADFSGLKCLPQHRKLHPSTYLSRLARPRYKGERDGR